MTPVTAVSSATAPSTRICRVVRPPIAGILPGGVEGGVRGRFRGMQTNQLSPDTLRRLAELRPTEGKVVSLYLNLDPAEFGDGRARSSSINSVLDEAERRARDEKPPVRDDVQRIRDLFK